MGSDQTFRLDLEGASTPLWASLPTDLSIRYFPAEEPICRAFVHWDPVALPIQKGARVGEIQVVDDRGRVLKTEVLQAKDAVSGTFAFRLKRWFRDCFDEGLDWKFDKTWFFFLGE